MRDTASSTTRPSPQGLSRTRASRSGYSSSTPTCTRATERHEILRGDPSIFTFSIHGAKNFPFHKEDSDLDAPLPDGADDTEFLATLERNLEKALDAADADLAIYLAGADPFEGDRLGRLSVTKSGLAERDRMVLETCRDCGIPVAVTMAGGYARDVGDTVDVHFQSIKRAADLLEERVAGIASTYPF